jgi:hypothetical protein
MKRNFLAFMLVMMGTLVATGATTGAVAQTLAAPAEKPILTISGKIATTNKDDTAQFDRPMLEALGMETIETTTPWFKGPVKFEGVPLAKLMQRVGASGERALFIALNDYSSEIPVEDFAKHNVILALKRDGQYMPISDKGPLFVIYPFDSKPELKSQAYYGRAVWQVAKIVVK